MKECKNNCEQWRIGVSALGSIIIRTGSPCIYSKPLGAPHEINNCPWCDSGKLIDKEKSLRKEFCDTFVKILKMPLMFNEAAAEIMFSKYKITKREKSNED